MAAKRIQNNLIYLNLVKVACGIDYTLALSDKGKVYGWGSNTNGRLNLYYNDDVLSPIMVNDLFLKLYYDKPKKNRKA